MTKTFGSSLLFIYIYLNLVKETFAQDIRITQPENTGVQVGGRAGSAIVQNIFNSVVTIIFSIAILAFLIMLIWGAFDIIASGGNKDKIQGGRKRITTAIIGVVVLALAFFIARVVGDIVGINIGPDSTLQIPRLLDGDASPGNGADGNVQ